MHLAPLEGFVIGITADRRWDEQAELFRRRGASIAYGPTVATHYLDSDEALREATQRVIDHRPDFLVATTGIGVRAWFEAAQAWGKVEDLLQALSSTRIVARGPKAAAALTVAGLDPGASAPGERMVDLLQVLKAEGVGDRTIALQHYGATDEALVGQLRAWGASVIDVPVYRYGLPEAREPAHQLIEAVVERRVDAVTFTSAPAVVNMSRLAAQRGLDQPLVEAFNSGQVVAGCIGEVCAGGAREVGVVNLVIPPKGRLGLLVRCLTDVLGARRRRFVVGDGRVVVQGRAVSVDGETVRLSPTEHTVLQMLLRNPGAVVSIASLVQPSDASLPPTPEALHATLSRLRRSLGPAGAALRTVRGRGYAFDAPRETRGESPPVR